MIPIVTQNYYAIISVECQCSFDGISLKFQQNRIETPKASAGNLGVNCEDILVRAPEEIIGQVPMRNP